MTTEDPMSARILLLRVGWMDRYAGVTASDGIAGGGSFVAEHGFGHEIFNFQPFNGKVYGYAQPPGRKERWLESQINLNRLGARTNEDQISGILVVWVSTARTGGAYVVGWYKNATVHRHYQNPPEGSYRKHGETDIGYYVTASAEDSTLLPADQRVFQLKQQQVGGMGQSNVWYADAPEHHKALRERLLAYIETGRPTLPPPSPAEGTPRQTDPYIRQRVEEKAVELTWAHFASFGYELQSVEADNVGWDLTAKLGNREFKLEVKGLSGTHLVVELTPNEYRAMKANRDQYRVCVVTSALQNPRLEIFAYSTESGKWESHLPGRRALLIEDIVAARCSAV